MIISTDKTSFDSYIQNPSIVKFYSSGCPSCEKLAPVFEQMAEQHTAYTFLNINLDEDITLAERYGIDHIPAVMMFDKGEKVKTNIGYMDGTQFCQFIESGD